MNFLLFILLFPFSINDFEEKPGSIEGTVLDSLDHKPVSGIIVEILNTDKKFTTGDNGKFEFHNLIPGKYDLVLRGAWHQPLRLENIDVKTDEPTVLKIFLVKYDLTKVIPMDIPRKRNYAGPSKMKIVKPDSNIDYKIRVVKPDPNVDYKMIIVIPDSVTDVIIDVLKNDPEKRSE
jgi:hypothetical protein